MFLCMGKTSAEKEIVWRARVKEWGESGETAKEFSKKHGFTPSTLYGWARRFSQTETSGFVRLVSKGAATMTSASAVAKNTVTVEVRGAQVRVVPGFDATLLAQVVQALNGGPP
jgi:transposase-like protein